MPFSMSLQINTFTSFPMLLQIVRFNLPIERYTPIGGMISDADGEWLIRYEYAEVEYFIKFYDTCPVLAFPELLVYVASVRCVSEFVFSPFHMPRNGRMWRNGKFPVTDGRQVRRPTHWEMRFFFAVVIAHQIESVDIFDIFQLTAVRPFASNLNKINFLKLRLLRICFPSAFSSLTQR